MSMNQLQIALHGYENLAPALNLNLNGDVSDNVEQWITTEVCPIVEQLVDSKRFQSTVLWSVNHFSPSVATDERKLVLDVEQNLLDLAAGIVTLSDVAEQEDFSGDPAMGSFMDRHRSTAVYIANKPWFDLVCTQDFFGPTQGLHLDTAKLDSVHTQAFRGRCVSLPLGDYVLRLLVYRVEYWVSILTRMVQDALVMVPNGLKSGKRYEVISTIFSRKASLDESVERLLSACTEPGRQRHREAATTLTLVYSAYARNPKLQWLGGNDSWWKVGGRIIRSWVRRRGTVQNQVRDASGAIVLTPPVQESLCDPAIIRHIAYSLQEMSSFFGAIDDPNEVIADFVHRARLVMVDREPREVFFDGAVVDNVIWDKHAKSWDLLWKLALNPRMVVDHEALAQCTVKSFRSRRNRLATILGENSMLDSLIETATGLGYKLNLSPADVILLEDDGFGNLRARSPRNI